MTNLGSILKSRDITLATKVHLVKVMIFPVVMYACESWTIKKISTEELMLLNCGIGEGTGGKEWKEWLTLFWGAPKSLQMVIAAMKLKDAYSLEGKL